MHGSAQPEDPLEPTSKEETLPGPVGSAGHSSIGDRTLLNLSTGDAVNGSRVLADTELDSALQLLVERAQYITGATGTALALPQGEEMVCRASAGSSAPSVGARLQVRSGLTGESIARRQLLRCDNAESDPRVNLDACRALGIASIVVLPLLRKDGEVRGLFELFSDHPYAFEERDLIALERMAALTVTALDLAEQREKFVPAVVPPRDLEPTVESSLGRMAPAESSVAQKAPEIAPISFSPDVSAFPLDATLKVPLHSAADSIADAEVEEPPVSRAESTVVAPSQEPVTPALPIPAAVTAPIITPPIITAPSVSLPTPEPDAIAPAGVPEAMLRVQKCATCGFPVSEGRTLCLDCEKKDREKTDREKKELEKKRRDLELEPEKDRSQASQLVSAPAGPERASELAPADGTQPEFIPAFLANAAPPQESWLADHVNLLAIVVLILGILVAVVVFR
jgi:putative methionine-R-sulfoxide reductase with GAF domain